MPHGAPHRLLFAAACFACVALATACGPDSDRSSGGGGGRTSGAGGGAPPASSDLTTDSAAPDAGPGIARDLRSPERARVWAELVRGGAETAAAAIPLLAVPADLKNTAAARPQARADAFERTATDLCLILAEIGPAANGAAAALVQVLRDAQPGPARDAAAVALTRIGMSAAQAKAAIDAFRPAARCRSSLAAVAIGSAIGERPDAPALASVVAVHSPEAPVLFLSILASHLRTPGGEAAVAPVLAAAAPPLVSLPGRFERNLTDLAPLMAIADPACAAPLGIIAADCAAGGDESHAIGLVTTLGPPAADAIAARLADLPATLSATRIPPSQALWTRLAESVTRIDPVVRTLRQLPERFEPGPALGRALVRLCRLDADTPRRLLARLPLAALSEAENLDVADACLEALASNGPDATAVGGYVRVCGACRRDGVAVARRVLAVAAPMPAERHAALASQVLTELLGFEWFDGVAPVRRELQLALAGLITSDQPAERLLGLTAAVAGGSTEVAAAAEAMLADADPRTRERALAALMGIANQCTDRAGLNAAIAIATRRVPQKGFQFPVEVPLDDIQKLDRRWWEAAANACAADLAALIDASSHRHDDERICALARYSTDRYGQVAKAAARRIDAQVKSGELRPPLQCLIDVMATNPSSLPRQVPQYLLDVASRQLTVGEKRAAEGSDQICFRDGTALSVIFSGRISGNVVKRALMPAMRGRGGPELGILPAAAVEVLLEVSSQSAGERKEIFDFAEACLSEPNVPLRSWAAAITAMAKADAVRTAALVRTFIAGKEPLDAVACVPQMRGQARSFNRDLRALIDASPAASPLQSLAIRALFAVAPLDRISASTFLEAQLVEKWSRTSPLRIARADREMWDGYARAIADAVTGEGQLTSAATAIAVRLIADGWIAIPAEKSGALLIATACADASPTNLPAPAYLRAATTRAFDTAVDPAALASALTRGHGQHLLDIIEEQYPGRAAAYGEVLGRAAAACTNPPRASARLLAAIGDPEACVAYARAFLAAGGKPANLGGVDVPWEELVGVAPGAAAARLAEEAAALVGSADPLDADCLTALLEAIAPAAGPNAAVAKAAAALVAGQINTPRFQQSPRRRALLRVQLAYEPDPGALIALALPVDYVPNAHDPADEDRSAVARWRPAICDALLAEVATMTDADAVRLAGAPAGSRNPGQAESRALRAVALLRALNDPAPPPAAVTPSSRLWRRVPPALDGALTRAMPSAAAPRRGAFAACAAGSADPGVVAILVSWAEAGDPLALRGIAAALGSDAGTPLTAGALLRALAALGEAEAAAVAPACRAELLAGLPREDAALLAAAGALRKSAVPAAAVAGAFAAYRLSR